MWKLIYQYFLFACVILSVSTIWYESPFQKAILIGTWVVFFADYMVFLYLSKDRFQYIKKHPFDLIALIPLDSIFQSAKLIRLYRLWRIKTITKRFSNPIIGKAMGMSPQTWFLTSFVFVIVSTFPFYFYEPVVDSFQDAAIWSFGSLLFVGRFSVEPTAFVSKIVIVVLTIVGILLHALIVRTVFHYVDQLRRNWSSKDDQSKEA
ncbi:hypothetical protein [Pseudalkalibacillus hwajinpoensis]|uniref:Two pore domain potassium channel family protein n=1 Tax=Guptibacillus hwajinpoensis TaxID=208199 RepID=A0A4U1MJU4_9BACL|nr:hypothetical protein [Pseudalkalibacillus hwajinpoensis]TKD71393.1 hypothetical protein FBF83_00865 [Pseudalkalibacillus hwajinpoensis]